jgi:aryl-alcohol dehydrogenase-like predicted oxidoreductase
MRVRKALLRGPLGFGAAPLGNMFRYIPDAEAWATVEAAWDQGTRYFDTAPFYGAGLSEIRLGKILSKHNRDEYYKVFIKAAALQFSPAHPAVAAVIPGASRPERIAEDHATLKASIPDDFWHELRNQGLVVPTAPLPIDE